ncbi:hypothetical protein OMAG_002587, partial [Candidatus Omnitrophus magneticus]
MDSRFRGNDKRGQIPAFAGMTKGGRFPLSEGMTKGGRFPLSEAVSQLVSHFKNGVELVK